MAPLPTISPRYHYAALAVLLLLSILFWNSEVLTPVKLFVVLLHELSHALAAILTGGDVQHIEIDPGIGGLAVTRGGWEWLIVSSGYIGSMLLGSLILLGSVRERWTRMLAGGVSLMVLIVTAFFVRNAFGVIFGLLFGIGLLIAARKLPLPLLSLVVQYLGAMSCLYALVDVQEDLLTLEHRLTDATILESMTGIPAIIWGVAWSLLALAVFLLTLRLMWRRAGVGQNQTGSAI